MGYIFDFSTAADYEKWFNGPNNAVAMNLQNQLMIDLLKPHRNESVLGIGCGTGASLQPLLDMGLQTSAIDPSPYMLDIKRKYLDKRVDLHRGAAEDLPFEDNSFNYTCLINILEFSDNPKKTIEEACRTAKDKMFLGVFNKFSVKSVQRRILGAFSSTFFNRAKFFSIWELKQIIWELLGDVPISWKTVGQLNPTSGKIGQHLEGSKIIQKYPFCEYIGMVVPLLPRYRTKSIPLKYKSKPAGRVLAAKKSLTTNEKRNVLEK